jgi:hypothetical protein
MEPSRRGGFIVYGSASFFSVGPNRLIAGDDWFERAHEVAEENGSSSRNWKGHAMAAR